MGIASSGLQSKGLPKVLFFLLSGVTEFGLRWCRNMRDIILG